MAHTPSPRPTVRALWGPLALLYVGSGLPYGLLNEGLPASLRRAGVALPVVSQVVVDVGVPWTLKFLWAPLLDRVGTRLLWTRLALGALAVLLFLYAEHPIGVDPGDLSSPALGAGFFLLVAAAVAAATQDVAVDAWTIQACPPDRLAAANGVRTPAYRVGMILGGGVLVWAAGALGWPWAWRSAGLLCGALLVLSIAVPAVPRVPLSGLPLVEPVRRLAARFGTAPFVGFALFVLLFKVGDYAMAPLTKAFQVDAGLTDGEIGVLGSLGIGATILGGILGAWATTRWGTFRALWVLGLLQAASNLTYAAAAQWPSWAGLRAAILIEPFCSGLGTAPFLVLLMASCDREHAGTQFALLTALFGIGRWLAGRWAGDAATSLGYPLWFAITFLLALPAFALLPLLRRGNLGWVPGTDPS